MEVRLVTAASRGFFFSLAWITIGASPLTIAASLLTIAASPLTIAALPLTIAASPLTVAASPLTIAASPLTIAASLPKKNPSGTQGNGLPEFLQNLSRKFAHKIRDLCRYSSTVPEFCNVLWEKPVILAQLLLDLKIFVSHDSSSSVCKKCARKIVNCYKLFVELEKAFAVGCAVEEANESAPRTPTRERFLLLPTVLANSSNHSRAQRQYRMQVNNMFMVNFIFGPSKANSWRRKSRGTQRRLLSKSIY